MRTKFALLGLVLALLLLLSSCGSAAAPGPAPEPIDPPKRAAVLFSSLAEAWVSAGGTVSITVGESVERGFAREDAALVDDGAGKTINTELLLSLEPDIVICSADLPAQVEAAELAQKAGIPTLILHLESFSDYLSVLDRMTRLTGNREAYENAVAMQEEIRGILADDALKALGTPRILFIRAGSTDASTKAKQGSDHFACAMLEEMGCRNVLSDAPILADGLNMEAMIDIDPDYIFFSMMGDEEAARAHIADLLAGELWQTLTAVKEGRVFILPKDLFHYKPNARWAEAYRFLADLLIGDGHE